MEQLNDRILSVYDETADNQEKITAIFLDFMKLNYEIDTKSKRLLILIEYLLFLRNAQSPILEILTNFISKNIAEKIYDNIAPARELLTNNFSNLRAKEKFIIVEKVRKSIDYHFTITNIYEILQLLEDDILFCLKWRIYKEREETLTFSEAKDEYKLTPSDLDNIPYYEHIHSLYNRVCKIYVVEDIKDYVDKKYGQAKLDERRLKSEVRREKMKETKQMKEKKQAEMENERKNMVIQLLAENGYYYDDDNYEASSFIYNNGKFEPEKILEMAKNIHDDKAIKIERRELLNAELEKYGLSFRRDSMLCHEYVEFGNRDLMFVVNTMREMDFLMNKTEYQTLWRKRCLEYYDGVLRRVVCIRKYKLLMNREEDIYKTYAVEKYLEKMKESGNTINERYLCPNIVWRIQQITESEEINKKIEADLENEREERKKKNIQSYSNKKSKRNTEIIDV
jgi:hypothetical protein